MTTAKIVAGVVLACSVAATSVALVRAPAAPAPAGTVSTRSTQAGTAVPKGHVAEAPLQGATPLNVVATTDMPAETVVPPTEPAPARPAPMAPSRPHARHAETAIPGASPDVAGAVGAEAQLLRDADAALRANDAPRALALLNQHAASFPNGVLVEERTAERVVVLCALGRTAEARDLASRFLEEHRRSPLAERVRGSCASQ